jgi:hypothetical protein
LTPKCSIALLRRFTGLYLMTQHDCPAYTDGLYWTNTAAVVVSTLMIILFKTGRTLLQIVSAEGSRGLWAIDNLLKKTCPGLKTSREVPGLTRSIKRLGVKGKVIFAV